MYPLRNMQYSEAFAVSCKQICGKFDDSTEWLVYRCDAHIFIELLDCLCIQFGDDGRAFSVFGKDSVSVQQKISLLCEDLESKMTLFKLIEDVVTKGATPR